MCCKNLKTNCSLLGSQPLCPVVLDLLICHKFSVYDFGLFIISHCQLNQSRNTICMFTFTEINSFNTFDLCEVVL